jgi:hypothetical protein
LEPGFEVGDFGRERQMQGRGGSKKLKSPADH